MDNHVLPGRVTSGLCGKGSGKQTTGKCGKQPHVFFRAHRSSRPSLAEGVALTLCVPPFQLLRTNEPFYLGSSEASCLVDICNRVSFPKVRVDFLLLRCHLQWAIHPVKICGISGWSSTTWFWENDGKFVEHSQADCVIVICSVFCFFFSLKREIVM